MPLATIVGTVQCLAHRGFAGVYPENTLAAVRGAAADGADAVEVDVRRCASGEVVVCHDETVDRVSDGSGPVAAHSRDQLASLDVLGTGAGIPTLRTVVESLPPGVGLNVELKEREIAPAVLRLLQAHAGERDWWLSAFDRAALTAAQEAAADIDGLAEGTVPTALLVSTDTSNPVDAARTASTRAVHPHTDLCTGSLVAAAHEKGLAVNAWTVRTESTARRVASAGVDGLIADAPAACLTDSPDSGGV